MTSEAGLCRTWLEASRDERIVAAMESIQKNIELQIQEREPVCTASGRCCHFERFGHRLYVTGLEAAYALDRLPRARSLETARLGDAVEAGVCPFQVGHLCGIHPVRPIGCRVFFCDPSAKAWVHRLAEGACDQIKAVHDRFGIEYRYMEWRAMLGMFQSVGVGAEPSRPIEFEPADPFVPISVRRAGPSSGG